MIIVIQSKRYAFAWHIIGKSWYVPSDSVNDYAIGTSKPNYPMPVTAGTAAMSVYHQDGWPNTIWPCKMVKDELKYLR